MSETRSPSNVSLENGLVADSIKMPISYDKIVSSPVFTFIVGKQHKPMTIHTALVAEQSPVLRKLVNGSMEEAQSGRVIWEDTDEDTFARFAQFVYTGDYSPASYELCEQEIDRNREPENEANEIPADVDVIVEVIEEDPHVDLPVEEPWDSWGLSKKDKKGGKKMSKPKSPQRSRFHDRMYNMPASSFLMKQRCKARANTSACEDYTPVFLGHARLYDLAETYNIESLKAVVLNKLHKTLCKFTPYEDRYDDVLELLHYTYKNTPDRTQLDPLRELVTQYIAYEAKQVTHTERCLSLVEQGGELARDLFAMLLERVTD